MDGAEFDAFILANMPHFIAMHYQRLLKTQQPQEQAELIVQIYNLVLRTLTIILVSQYLIRDRESVSHPYLDELLLQKFHHLTPDAWEEIFFTALKAYEGKQDLFFIPELYDFYWDTSTFPHKRRVEVSLPFHRLTQAAVEVQMKRLLPQDELSWKMWAEKLREHLQQVLLNLSFIGTYDLIRVLDLDEQFYSFEMHKGVHLSKDRQPRPKFIKLNSGWFYLRTRGKDFLLLHPLLVFWEGELERNELVSTDTGIFDRRVYEQLQYLLAVSGQTRVDDKRIQEFVTLIYDTIEEAKHKRQGAEKLTWVQLCDICEDISRRRMATVQRKYQKELYLQRDRIRQELEVFLHDPEKRCFVLVGKSGVGKSNFLLALGEELHRSRSDVCVLMYDGANLEVTSSVTEVIGQDVSDRLLLSGRHVQQIWHEIAKIDGIEERLVVLFVDAINENPQAKELLRQLDALVQGPWPWLKIVFTSRPETWQTIKRGVKLAEALYYQEQGAETLEVKLEDFSYSEKMEPFSRQELPEVYSKYQRVFKMRTPYEALSHELRETLRDPLNLWLVAEISKIYGGEVLPGSLRATILIEQYVNTLLPEEALRFLEKQLVPLMVKEGHYSNMITAEELDTAADALYMSVFSEQVLSDGRAANLSFRHLSDADILVVQKQGIDQKIAFKYERFYEYFVGRRIFSLSEAQRDQYTFYLGLIEETTRSPFLWGAVRNALVQEAKGYGSETILKLSRTTRQRVKEMMVSVLITLGEDVDVAEQVERLLRKLIPQEKKATEWRKAKQLLGKTSEVFATASRNAAKIAVEAAGTLCIPWTLQEAALQADSTIRTEAVRYAYMLWEHDQAKGFEILEYLAKNARSGFLPNLIAFESAFGLSLIIFFEHSRDEAVLRRLQSIWHEIITKILSLQERSRRWVRAFREFIRESLFSLITTIVFHFLREHPAYNVINYHGLETFFHLGASEKMLYRNLVQYLDVEGNYTKEQMENDYLKAIKINDLLIYLVTVLGLIAHARYSPLAFLPFLKKLRDEARKDVGSYYLADIANALEMALVRNPTIDEIFDFYVDTVKVCHEYYARYPKALLNRFSEAPEVLQLGPYIDLQYRRTGSARTPWFEALIQTALSQGDTPFFDVLFAQELPLVGIDRQKPRAALDVLALFFKSIMETPSKNGSAEVRQMIQSFLARLRIYYPDEVDDFLEEQQASKEFRLQVQTNEPVETIGVLLGEKAFSFVLNDVLMNSSGLLSQLMRILDKATDCKDLRAWLDYFIREIINLIYGGEALRQSVEE